MPILRLLSVLGQKPEPKLWSALYVAYLENKSGTVFFGSLYITASSSVL